ncbi:Nucleotide-binding universal stress protein, UspA family [Lentzea fradiae]|uniref:Nucleotide-binding universal stress protein, UspA family n=1 Tax=Lentzea fradiae TaxID=200378 RepID=A0A1G7SFP7_9PSEU|nr:universal stress protein [Lentzea fradiae]SDG21897.1 Nucleotide-binding universal stress protein, UspA family [Lentzea fradiae]
MTVVVWVADDTWQDCVDAARGCSGDVLLLHVSDHDVPGAAHGAFAGLLGRGHPERDPGTRLDGLAADHAESLLDAAAERLGRPCAKEARVGRVEHEVVEAATNASLLVVCRDVGHVGPRSLGPATRFVVDHAPCPVLLVWPT